MVRVPRRLAVAGIVALSGPVLTACGSTTHFVERSAQELTVASHTWRFLGFNAPELTSVPGATSCGRVVDQATLNSILSNARQSGASVVRTWFFQSYYDMSNASGRWRRITPRWAAFDRLLKAATSYGIKVIPVLVDEWPYCEVAPVSKGLDFYQRGYEQPGYGYPLSFKSYAMAIARRYASNPTIAFWQIGNELESNSPGGCDERNSANALRAFADDMTRSIKRADPHHLVSLGTIGTGQCGLVGRDYQYVHAGEVDVCEYHDYGDAIHSIPSVEPGELGQRIAQCRALNKPLFIGEAGIVADVGDIGQSTAKITGTSLRLRAGFFDAKMTAAFDDGLVGYVIWDKRQDASNSDYTYNTDRYNVGPSSRLVDPTHDLKDIRLHPGHDPVRFREGRCGRLANRPGLQRPVRIELHERGLGRETLACGDDPDSPRPCRTTCLHAGHWANR